MDIFVLTLVVWGYVICAGVVYVGVLMDFSAVYRVNDADLHLIEDEWFKEQMYKHLPRLRRIAFWFSLAGPFMIPALLIGTSWGKVRKLHKLEGWNPVTVSLKKQAG